VPEIFFGVYSGYDYEENAVENILNDVRNNSPNTIRK
jgi:hypothetical protein